jgi:DNA-binding NtrC family response regulator
MARGRVIRPEHLGLVTAAAAEAGGIAVSLSNVEREHVARVMSFTGGHKARAAEILGVSRPRLNRLLEKHGLEDAQ